MHTGDRTGDRTCTQETGRAHRRHDVHTGVSELSDLLFVGFVLLSPLERHLYIKSYDLKGNILLCFYPTCILLRFVIFQTLLTINKVLLNLMELLKRKLYKLNKVYPFCWVTLGDSVAVLPNLCCAVAVV